MSLSVLIHSIAGTIAVLAGVAAFAAPKGGRMHRRAGRVFLVAMMVTGAGGAVLALQTPMAIAAIVGLFVCYLIATSYLTVKPWGARGRRFEIPAVGLAASLALASLAFGLEAQTSADGLKDGFGPGPYFFFAGLIAFCAALDLSVVLRSGLAGAQRIARHLWRMGFALFVAVGSLFNGPGAGAFPEAVRGSPLLQAPEPIVLAVTLGWLAYVLVAKRFRRDAAP